MKLGIMNNPSNSLVDEIVSIGQHGYDFVDLTIEGPKAFEVKIDEIKSILNEFNLSVVGHTDPCLPYAYPIQSIRKACLEELERCAIIFSKLGATVMNIHPCYFSPPAMRQSLFELNIEALKPIVEMGANHGIGVVFENYRTPFNSLVSFERLFAEIPNLGLHLDFGHVNLGYDDPRDYCSKFGERIKHVHFSDNRSTGDHHMPLGVGNVNWKNVINGLKSIQYDDTITLEVFCDDASMRFKYLDLSRQHVLDLLKED